ncbi:DUF645 family protein [Shewanella sp. MM_2022_3]|nr:DUF645 family protein [Shewanella sp. MM_2022_3]
MLSLSRTLNRGQVSL